MASVLEGSDIENVENIKYKKYESAGSVSDLVNRVPAELQFDTDSLTPLPGCPLEVVRRRYTLSASDLLRSLQILVDEVTFQDGDVYSVCSLYPQDDDAMESVPKSPTTWISGLQGEDTLKGHLNNLLNIMDETSPVSKLVEMMRRYDGELFEKLVENGKIPKIDHYYSIATDELFKEMRAHLLEGENEQEKARRYTVAIARIEYKSSKLVDDMRDRWEDYQEDEDDYN